MSDEIERRIDRIEDKIDRLEDKVEQFKIDIIGDIHIIDKNIDAFMKEVDDHIKEEAETIRELQGLASIAPDLKLMIESNIRSNIIKEEKDKNKKELFKKAKLYSALGGAATTLFTAIYYALKVKGLL